MNTFLTVRQDIANGTRYKIDLIGKSLKVDGQYLIRNGKPVDEVFWESVEDLGYSWDSVEKHYQRFKHSVPHERQRESYFKGLKANDLSDDDMLYGGDRNVAQFILETYVLVGGMTGELKVDEGHWFWQSSNDKELVVLKEWL